MHQDRSARRRHGRFRGRCRRTSLNDHAHAPSRHGEPRRPSSAHRPTAAHSRRPHYRAETRIKPPAQNMGNHERPRCPRRRPDRRATASDNHASDHQQPDQPKRHPAPTSTADGPGGPRARAASLSTPHPAMHSKGIKVGQRDAPAAPSSTQPPTHSHTPDITLRHHPGLLAASLPGRPKRCAAPIGRKPINVNKPATR